MNNEEQNNDKKMVQVPAEVLQDMMNKINALTAAVGGVSQQKPEEVKNRIYNVRYVDNKPVIAFANVGHESAPVYVYQKPNPLKPTEEVDYVKVILLDPKTGEQEAPMEVPYLDFIKNSRRVTVKAIKVEKRPWKNRTGEQVEKQKVDWDKFRMESTGDQVELQVAGFTQVFTVEDPEGNKYTLTEQTINA